MRLFLVAATCAAALLSLIALRSIPFDNDIQVMLPRQPEVLRGFQFFRESPLAKNVAVSFKLKDGKGTVSDLIKAADQFTSQINSPMITHVLSGVDSKQSLGEIQEFVRLAPQLMKKEQLDLIEGKLNAPFTGKKLEKFYHLLLSPGASFLTPVAKQDPLGFQEKALQDLRELSSNLDYDVQLQEGHLISRDGRRALVVLETNVPITDGYGAKKLISYVQELLKNLPEPVSADLISGHLHPISNEKVVMRDIAVTTTVSSVAFLIIFIVLFKDLRAILLFTIPLLAVLISVPICGLFTGKISFIIMGMGAVIAGIADDYCIHVYMAMQSGESRKQAMGEVAKTVAMGAFTTSAVFSVFLFSQVPGYRELALLTIISLLLSLVFALWVLPYFLEPDQIKIKKSPPVWKESTAFDKPAILVWILLIAASVALIPSAHFQSDVKQYDGSEASVFKAEENFGKDWGEKKRPAVLVVKSSDFDGALALHNRLTPEITEALGKNKLISLSGIWPDEKTRLGNLERWNSFWRGEREEKLRGLIQVSAAPYGFSADAFDAFFKMLQLDPKEIKAFEQLNLLAQLKRRFAFEVKDGYRLVSFFPDEPELVSAVNRKISQMPDVFVVSAERFKALLSSSILSESAVMSLAIVTMIVTMTFLFLRNIVLTLIALIPVVTSILLIFGIGNLFKVPLNAASMVALLVVGGLCIDSGIFMVNHCHHQLKTNTRRSVTVSTLTTILGAGALVFAKHPVLFSYGTTMAFGITAGYLAAMFVVPAIYRRFIKAAAAV